MSKIPKTLGLYARDGVNIVRCPVVNKRGERCFGHQHVHISLKELANIRHGEEKVVTANFSCNHKGVKKIVLSRRPAWK